MVETGTQVVDGIRILVTEYIEDGVKYTTEFFEDPTLGNVYRIYSHAIEPIVVTVEFAVDVFILDDIRCIFNIDPCSDAEKFIILASWGLDLASAGITLVAKAGVKSLAVASKAGAAGVSAALRASRASVELAHKVGKKLIDATIYTHRVRSLAEVYTTALRRYPNLQRIRDGLGDGIDHFDDLVRSVFDKCAHGPNKCYGNEKEVDSINIAYEQGDTITEVVEDQSTEFKKVIDGENVRGAPDHISITKSSLESWGESRTITNASPGYVLKRSKLALANGYACFTLFVHGSQPGTKDFGKELSNVTISSMIDAANEVGIKFRLFDTTRGGVIKAFDNCK